jgi:hypothetical protein
MNVEVSCRGSHTRNGVPRDFAFEYGKRCQRRILSSVITIDGGTVGSRHKDLLGDYWNYSCELGSSGNDKTDWIFIFKVAPPGFASR